MSARFIAAATVTHKEGDMKVAAGDPAQIMQIPTICCLNVDDNGRLTSCYANAKVRVGDCIYPIEVPLNILKVEK